MDYALWHGQQAWIERLAGDQFVPARSLAPDGEFGWVGTAAMLGARLPEFERQQELALRAVAALRRRHLQPYAAKNFKEILRQCDLYGADPLAEDEFGHTAWQQAVSRALDEPAFAKNSLAPLFERIAPAVIDVQVDSRLVRLERHQGEYWVLTLILAGLKTQWTRCAARPHVRGKYARRFFVDYLQLTLDALPAHLWKDQRRKRS
jgi:hypothetical protein